MYQPICEAHRKELLRFLLLKTAAVRSGVKPGELLRIRHCYQSRNAEGFPFCLYRQDILEIMKLHYLELREEDDSSLILFYHPSTLRNTLARPENREFLRRFGYPENAATDDLLALLQHHSRRPGLPHEVGIFIGYPAKDVAGFITRESRRIYIPQADWQIFGEVGISLLRMNLYRRAEAVARRILDSCEDLQSFFERMHRPLHRDLAPAARLCTLAPRDRELFLNQELAKAN